MRNRLAWSLVLIAMGTSVASAGPVPTGAKSDGNWEDASIWTGGAVPGPTNDVYIGSTSDVPSGAAATATVTLTADESAADVYLGNSAEGLNADGTLNLDGHTLAVSGSMNLGNVVGLGEGTSSGGVWGFNEGNGGSFSATSLNIANSSNALGSFSGFTFGANDTVGSLALTNGASATTTAMGNVTGSVDVGVSDIGNGGLLKLGADMKLTGGVTVVGGTNAPGAPSGYGVFDMAGHSLTASFLNVGFVGSNVALDNPGAITVGSLSINEMNFDINSNDKVTNFALQLGSTTLNNSVTNLTLGGAMATTTATGSVTGSVTLGYNDGFYATPSLPSTLTLGADMTLTGNLNVGDGSVFNAQGHALTADTMTVGDVAGGPAATVEDLGRVALNNLVLGQKIQDNSIPVGSSAMTLHGGDTINDSIDVRGGSVLTVDQVAGAGLTLNGTALDSLSIDSNPLAPSSMVLDFAGAGWDFRWMDPSGGNWISTLDALIDDGQIVIEMPSTDHLRVYDSNGYTYISAVPEPSSLLLLGLGAVGAALVARKKGRSRG